MTLNEAKEIGANPEHPNHSGKLVLARLKLTNHALRQFASSPNQLKTRKLIENIEKLPKHLWHYDPTQHSEEEIETPIVGHVTIERARQILSENEHLRRRVR